MAENTTVNLSGILKRRYGNHVTRLMPDNAIFQKMIPFSTMERIGDKYYQPVQLQNEHGITFASPGAGAFSFNSPIRGSVKQAAVDSYPMAFVSELDWEIARKADKQGDSAFESALDLVMESMMVSFRNYLESVMLYGGAPLATVSGAPVGNVIAIGAADWASGLWAGSEGAAVDIYVGSTATKRITTTITSVDLVNYKLTVADATAVADGDTIYWIGSRGNTPLGIHKILTTVGTLFDIDNTAYSLWQGNSYNVGGVLTHAKLDEALTLANDKGFHGKQTLLVSRPVWNHLMIEQAAKRSYTSADGTFRNGAEDVEFFTGSGIVRVKASNLVKNGYGYLINEKDFRRIGTDDVSLGDPANKDDVVRRFESKAGYQILAYSNQSLFCERPGYSTVLTGITLS